MILGEKTKEAARSGASSLSAQGLTTLPQGRLIIESARQGAYSSPISGLPSPLIDAATAEKL
jgi:hypothetical protein